MLAVLQLLQASLRSHACARSGHVEREGRACGSVQTTSRLHIACSLGFFHSSPSVVVTPASAGGVPGQGLSARKKMLMPRRNHGAPSSDGLQNTAFPGP